MSPWDEMLRRAAGEFAIPPAAFWRLSLKEWRALTHARVAPALGRGALSALMARFPDETEEQA
jgi:uncharacterized phage protein (TIGR02216 family)